MHTLTVIYTLPLGSELCVDAVPKGIRQRAHFGKGFRHDGHTVIYRGV